MIGCEGGVDDDEDDDDEDVDVDADTNPNVGANFVVESSLEILTCSEDSETADTGEVGEIMTSL